MIKLNLIPPYKKEEISEADKFRVALRWEVELAGIILIFISLLLSVNYIVKLNLSSAESSAGGDLEKMKRIEELDGKIKEINSKISEADRARKGQLHWENLFHKLNESFLDDIKLDRIETENYAVSLSGMAATREKLIEFKEKVEKEACFAEVELPLSSLVTKEDANFSLKFKIKEDCLK